MSFFRTETYTRLALALTHDNHGISSYNVLMALKAKRKYSNILRISNTAQSVNGETFSSGKRPSRLALPLLDQLTIFITTLLRF